jgi:hypothetical protein
MSHDGSRRENQWKKDYLGSQQGQKGVNTPKKRQISISKEIYTFQEIWIVGKLSKVKQTFSHFAYPRSPINSSNTCLALSLLAGVLNCLSFIFQPIATQSGVSEGNVGK